jgi:hypothetical protein
VPADAPKSDKFAKVVRLCERIYGTGEHTSTQILILATACLKLDRITQRTGFPPRIL